MKFKDFQAPVLFSSTFKTLNLGEKIQVLSRVCGNPVEDDMREILNSYNKRCTIVYRQSFSCKINGTEVKYCNKFTVKSRYNR